MTTKASETPPASTGDVDAERKRRRNAAIFVITLFAAPIVIVTASTLHASSEKDLAQRFLDAVRRDDAAGARRMCGGRACAALGSAARLPPGSPLIVLRGALQVSTSWNIATGWNERCVDASYRDSSGRSHSFWVQLEGSDGPFRIVDVDFTRPVGGPCSSD